MAFSSTREPHSTGDRFSSTRTCPSISTTTTTSRTPVNAGSSAPGLAATLGYYTLTITAPTSMILAQRLLTGDSLSQGGGSFPNRALVSSAIKLLLVFRRKNFFLPQITQTGSGLCGKNPCENLCFLISKKSGLKLLGFFKSFKDSLQSKYYWKVTVLRAARVGSVATRRLPSGECSGRRDWRKKSSLFSLRKPKDSIL